ncbi:MAG: (p)ppGpp synthetase SpoT/RelA [Chloroflexi bacterium]|nr:(p)ppGpp synthetase SpoT/RelA [Chloroflexota bacterium]
MVDAAIVPGTDQLFAAAAQYLPESDLETVRRALALATQAHENQQRASGEPYVGHPIAVAAIVAELHLDAATVAAALLHDVVEDTVVKLDEVERDFGPEIARIVDGVTKLDQLHWLSDEERPTNFHDAELAENLRKMFLAMADDLRVVLVKLADRLHNMRTLEPFRPEKQRRIAQETMEIYAPLANRLGIWEIKWQLEDLAFRYLEPEAYNRVAESVAQNRRERETYIRWAVDTLRAELEQNGVHGEVFGRPKHLYSIYNKMQERGAKISQIYDLLAVRVIVGELQECYHAVGIVHGLWHPLPGQFDDYIASPKQSGYQSLHTTVVAKDQPLEIQIRTREMNQIAEYGVAAHWRYKEGRKQNQKFDEKIAWLRQLMDWQKDIVGGAQEFVDNLRTDVFQQQVYIFTPKGELKELPSGSTPIDFAYRIHTEVGNRCVGAKVNGRLVSLDRALQNGDIVEIITSKTSRGPSRDWLFPESGFVKTAGAREKIRQWFRRAARDENIARGRDLIERELKRLGLVDVKLDDIAAAFKYSHLDDFFAAMGYGDIHPQQLASRLAVQAPPPVPIIPQNVVPTTERIGGIRVNGVGDLYTRMARCCNPVPGDQIVGFITRGRGITVHRPDCASIRNEDEPERLVEVEWGANAKDMFPVSMRILAYDREGLVRDIAAVVADEKLSLSGMHVDVLKDQTALVTASMDVPDLEKLSRVMARIQSVRDIFSVERDLIQTR